MHLNVFAGVGQHPRWKISEPSEKKWKDWDMFAVVNWSAKCDK